MRPNLDQVTQEFRSNYQGPPIAFFIAGGGFSALDFRKFPGGSKVYHTAVEPYTEDTANFLNKFCGSANVQDPNSFRFVNPEGTSCALEALSAYCNNNSNLLYVVINSALTTDRWRRGDNRAYIATSRGEMFVFNLNKLEEEEYNILFSKNPRLIDDVRRQEDLRVGQAALAIIMGDPNLVPELEPGEEIIRLHTSGQSRSINTSDVFARA